MKTLIFCTTYGKNLAQWEELHSRWINAIESGYLEGDKILLIDDGSPELPDWDGIEIIEENELPDNEPDSRGIVYHFKNNLGRPAFYNHRGWYRSFTFASVYAKKYGYEKIIHVEADSFLISKKFQTYLNEFKNGWEAFWCICHQIPETAIQIIAGQEHIDKLYEFSKLPPETFDGRPPDPGVEQGDPYFPYTVNKNFLGDRYGEKELKTYVPLEADYACQIRPTTFAWWLNN